MSHGFVIERNDPKNRQLIEYACGAAMHLWGTMEQAVRFATREDAIATATRVLGHSAFCDSKWRVVDAGVLNKVAK